ncbi:hypothetical protein IT575_00235 [bacterium]|nr:hypothetical protein [bacterium]
MGLRLLSAALLLLACVYARSGHSIAAPDTQPAADAVLTAAPQGYQERMAAFFEARAAGGLDEKEARRLTTLNLQILQQAIDRWSADHSVVNENGILRRHYPASISQLVQSGYLSAGLYPNPYTASGPGQLNALEVPLGWSPQAPGNFSYLVDLKSASEARSYVLVGYAGSQETGWDPDMDGRLNGICVQLSSGGLGSRPANVAMWQGGRSYNVGLMFGAPDNASAEFYFNKREGRLDPAAALDLARSQLHNLQLQLERFSVDYSPPDVEGLSWREQERRYPEAISALVQETYCLPGFYANPFTASSPIELNAREVPFGWTEEAPGNFSYLKHYNQAGMVDGYCLLLYADSLEAGRDATGDGVSDGVALWLSSNINLAKPETFYCGSQRVTVVNQ